MTNRSSTADREDKGRRFWTCAATRAVAGQEIFAAAFIGQVFASAGNFAVNIILANAVGPRLFGFWALGWIAIQVVAAVHNVAIQLPAQVLSRDDKGGIDQSFLAATAVLSAIYALAAALGVIGVMAIILPDFSWTIVAAFGVLTFGWLVNEFNRRALIARGSYKQMNISEMARALLTTGAVFALTVVAEGMTLLAGGAWIMSLILVAIGLLNARVLTRGSRLAKNTLLGAARRCWLHSRWMLPMGITSRAGPDVSLALAAGVLGPAAVGGFRAMAQIVSVLNLVFQSLQVALPVRIVEVRARSGDLAVGRLVKRLSLSLLLVFPLAMGGAIVLGPAVINLLLGPRYLAYVDVLYWLVLLYLVLFLQLPLSCWAHALGVGSGLVIPNMVGAAVAVALVVPLVSRLGIAGAAAAYVCMYLIEALGTAAVVARALRKRAGLQIDKGATC